MGDYRIIKRLITVRYRYIRKEYQAANIRSATDSDLLNKIFGCEGRSTAFAIRSTNNALRILKEHSAIDSTLIPIIIAFLPQCKTPFCLVVLPSRASPHRPDLYLENTEMKMRNWKITTWWLDFWLEIKPVLTLLASIVRTNVSRNCLLLSRWENWLRPVISWGFLPEST